VVNEKEEGAAVRRQEEETVTGTAESLLAFENAALPLAVILPTGRVAMANRATRTMLGYDFSELVGRTLFDLFGVDPAAWKQRLASDELVSPEHRERVTRKDGVEIEVRASTLLVTDDSGTLRYVIAKAVPDPR
jgi:PAS domain S-box-containing protein